MPQSRPIGRLLALLLLTACGGSDGMPSATVSDSAGVTLISVTAPDREWALEVEPDLSLGTVDGAGPTGFFRIQSVRFLPGGNLAVSDGGSDEARIFSETGQLVARWGGSGSGPGEFRSIGQIHPWGDSLLLHDPGNDRVQMWAGSGGMRTFRLETSEGRVVPLATTPEGRIVGVTIRGMMEVPGSGVVVDTARVALYDTSGQQVREIGHLPFVERLVVRRGDAVTVVSRPLGSAGLGALQGTDVCHAFGPRVEFRCLDPEGRLVRVTRVDMPARAVDATTEQAWWEWALDPDVPNREGLYRTLRDDIVLPDTLPAFSRMLADDTGRIWLQRFALPGEGDADLEWWIFEETAWAGRLRVPGRFALMDVDGTRLVGVWRDDLDVESVRVFGMR